MTLGQKIWLEIASSADGLSLADIGARVYGRERPATAAATLRAQIRRLRAGGRPIATILRSGKAAVYVAEVRR